MLFLFCGMPPRRRFGSSRVKIYSVSVYSTSSNMCILGADTATVPSTLKQHDAKRKKETNTQRGTLVQQNDGNIVTGRQQFSSIEIEPMRVAEAAAG